MNRYTLPTQIEVKKERFDIRNRGDYRIVLSCFNILYDNDLNDQEKILTCLLVFYEDFDDVDDLMDLKGDTRDELVKQMFWFFDCGNDYKNDKQKPRLIDWDKDSMLITSAINNVAKQEIRSLEYLHWWTFIGYYMAIGDCALSNIVAIRDKVANHKKLEKHEKEFINENPHYFDIDYRTKEEKDTDDWLQALWKGGSN